MNVECIDFLHVFLTILNCHKIFFEKIKLRKESEGEKSLTIVTSLMQRNKGKGMKSNF